MLRSKPPQNWSDLAALLDPAGMCGDPLSSGRPLDWHGLYRLAATQLVAPIFYLKLAERAVLHHVPDEVRDALDAIYQMNQERNDRQRLILKDTVQILNDAGIEPLLMKGSVSLLPGQPVHAASRMLTDIDLLTITGTPEDAESALLKAGYRHESVDAAKNFERSHHLAPLFHPSGYGYVEVHRRRFLSRVPPQALSYEAMCSEAEIVEWPGLNLRVPSLAHRLMHNALHQQIQNTTGFLPSRCSLRQLLEFVQLRNLPQASGLDWPSMLSGLDRLGLGDPVRTYFVTAERLFAQPLPPGVELSSKNHLDEGFMWFLTDHPRLLRSAVLAARLRNLPKRLATPSWYGRKLRTMRTRRNG